MLEDLKSITSNSMRTLMALEDEQIHAVVTVVNSLRAGSRDWLFVFKSGWSFQVTSSRTFWVNRPDDTEKVLRTEVARRQKSIESIEQVQKAMEVCDQLNEENGIEMRQKD